MYNTEELINIVNLHIEWHRALLWSWAAVNTVVSRSAIASNCRIRPGWKTEKQLWSRKRGPGCTQCTVTKYCWLWTLDNYLKWNVALWGEVGRGWECKLGTRIGEGGTEVVEHGRNSCNVQNVYRFNTKASTTFEVRTAYIRLNDQEPVEYRLFCRNFNFIWRWK